MLTRSKPLAHARSLHAPELLLPLYEAHANLHNHGVTFEEASTVFGDTLSLTIYDEEHSDAEDRLIIIGMSLQHRLLVVVHTDRGDTIRIISARRATAHERKTYERNAEQYG